VERLNIDDPGTSKAKATYNYRLQSYLVLVDGEGQVVEAWQGYREKEVLDEALSAIVEE
jgi:hypothetical protein